MDKRLTHPALYFDVVYFDRVVFDAKKVEASNLPGSYERASAANALELLSEVKRLRSALEYIRHFAGAVCEGYEACDHASCRASYNAWAKACEALGSEKE